MGLALQEMEMNREFHTLAALRERSSPRTFWIGGWVGAVSRIEPRLLGRLAHSPSRYTDYAAPAPKLHHRQKSVTQCDGRNRLRPRMFGR